MALTKEKAAELLNKKTKSKSLQNIQTAAKQAATSQHNQNLATTTQTARPSAGSTLAEQKVWDQNLSNQFGAPSGVPNSNVSQSEQNRRNQALDPNLGIGMNSENSAFLGKGINTVANGSATQARIFQEKSKQAQEAKQVGFENYIKNLQDTEEVGKYRQDLQDRIDEQKNINGSASKVLLGQMSKLESNNTLGRIAIARGLDPMNNGDLNTIRQELMGEYAGTDEFARISAEAGFTAADVQRGAREASYGGATLTESQIADELKLNAGQKLFWNGQTNKYEVRTGAIEDSDPFVRAEASLLKQKENAIADIDEKYKNSLSRARAAVAQYGNAQSRQHLADLLRRKDKEVTRVTEQVDKSLEDQAIKEEQRQATIEEVMLAGSADLTTEQKIKLEEANFIAEQQAINPNLSTAYLQNKWKDQNKYESVDPNGKANIATWENMLSNGEVNTGDQAAMYQQAIDLTGDPEMAFELLKTTGNTSLANDVRNAWTEKRYGTTGLNIENVAEIVKGLYSGEETSGLAVQKFAEDAPSIMDDETIGDQLRTLSTSLSASKEVKNAANTLLLDSKYDKTSSSNYLTEAQFKAGAGTQAERSAFISGTKELLKIKEGVSTGDKSMTDLIDSATPLETIQAQSLAVEVLGKRAGAKPENYNTVIALQKTINPDTGELYTIDDIGDILRKTDVSTVFEGDYRDAYEFVSSKMTAANRAETRDSLDRLLQNGDTAEAKDFILKLARDNAPTATATKVAGTEDALSSLAAIKNLVKEYSAQGGDTGLLSGKWEKLANRVGKTSSPELAGIANEIQLAIQAYRKSISGAAFTEAESEEYERIFPSTTRNLNLNAVKFDTLENKFNRDIDNFYSRSIGAQNYKSLLGENKPAKQEPTPKIEGIGTAPQINFNDVSALTSSVEGNPDSISVDQDKAGNKFNSFGSFQMNRDTVKNFAKEQGFTSTDPESQEFKDEWVKKSKEVGFQDSERNFIKKTHYEPQVAKLQESGLPDVLLNDKRFQSLIFDVSVNAGANSSLIIDALKGKEVTSIEQAIELVKQARLNGAQGHPMQTGLENRITKVASTLQ